MDWVAYLAGRGVPVCPPLKAADGGLAVLARENGEAYIITALRKAEGQLWDSNNPALWNAKVFHHWGRAMGAMHHAAKDYKVKAGLERRPEYSNDILQAVQPFPSVYRAAEEVVKEIAALPKDRNSYGLIHYDLHQNNFMIDGNQIHVFDFADCAYAWYATDIGVALAVGLWLGRVNDSGHDFTNDIIKHFLEGYREANALDAFWLSKIPLFMRACQISLFSCSYDAELPDDEMQREQIKNINNKIFLSGCHMDDSLFSQ